MRENIKKPKPKSKFKQLIQQSEKSGKIKWADAKKQIASWKE